MRLNDLLRWLFFCAVFQSVCTVPQLLEASLTFLKTTFPKKKEEEGEKTVLSVLIRCRFLRAEVHQIRRHRVQYGVVVQ